MDEYSQKLYERFKDLEINLVVHDTHPNGLPCYIEAHLGHNPKVKDKGSLVLDLGNYIYRLGLSYQMTPEFRGRGKKTTLRWFMSWKDIQKIRPNILKAFGKNNDCLEFEHYLPWEFRSLIIQNSSRGVIPQMKG